MRKIHIVIAVFKRLDLTKACLNSLANQTYCNFKVIIVDHCEEDVETGNYVSTLDERFVLLKGINSMWWTEATNHGIRHVLNQIDINLENDFVLTLNNDLTVKDNYLEELLKTYTKYQPCIVGSVSVDSEEENKIDFAGCKWNKITTRMPDLFHKRTKYSDIQKMEIIETDLLPGRGMLIPLNVFTEIGMFDTDLFPHYVSDYDFSYSAFKAGFRLLINPRAVVSSIVKESGDRFDKESLVKPSLKFFFETQKNIKSPINITNRWNWAQKHVRFSLIYFMIDSLRILVSYSVYSMKFYIRKLKN